MAVIRSGASTDELTVDATSKAARVTLYDAAGNALSGGGKQSYMASSTFTPVATPTDIVTIIGSATKTVRVWSFKITTTATAAGSHQFALIKRSAANTTGTFVAGTAVPLDSANAAATSVVGHYTANPGGLGTAVGTIITARVVSPVPVPASFASIITDAGFDLLSIWSNSGAPGFQPVTLRGIAQVLALNYAGAALVAGQTHAWNILWTEE